MLGAWAALPQWLARVARGRGASVCTPGVLADLAPAAAGATAAWTCVLHADDDKVPLLLHGRHARALHDVLQRHRTDSVLPVFLSGFGAEVKALPHEPHLASVSWTMERIALKALLDTQDAGVLQLWFEGNGQGLSTLVLQPVESGTMLTCQSDAWFEASAPTPSAPGAATSNAPSAAVCGSHDATAGATYGAAARGERTAGAQDARGRMATAAAPRSEASPPPPRAGAIVSAKTLLSPSAAPPPPVPAQVGRVACTLDGTRYTPISDVAPGTTVSVLGVVAHAPGLRPASRPSSDAMVRVEIQQPGDAYVLSVNLFARTHDRLPAHVAPGDAILLKALQIHDYRGHPRGVGPAFRPWSWATLAVDTAQAHSAPGTEMGAQERAALHDVLASARAPAPAPAPVPTPPRALVTLSDVHEGACVDLVAEVVAVYSRGKVPDLYVTDFTRHPLLGGHDARLARRYVRAVPPRNAHGYVFQIGLWGSQAPLCMRLQPGQCVRIEDVRVKRNALGGLQGALGRANDRGYRIEVLTPEHELAQGLARRRAAWLGDAAPPPAPPPPKRPRSASPDAGLPPPSLLPPSPPEPVHAQRFALDSDDSEALAAAAW